MKTIVYVDGFNLYYGAVRGTPFKWLDINKLCQLLLPKHKIHRIKYFTARVVARASAAPARTPPTVGLLRRTAGTWASKTRYRPA